MPHRDNCLFIVRHAWAEEVSEDGSDRSRSLTKKGRRRFEEVISRLIEQGLAIDRIATSPLTRAKQTAEIVAALLPNKPRIDIVEWLAPGSNWKAAIDWSIESGAKKVAWVGHAPDVGSLVSRAIGASNASIAMAKGSVASIHFSQNFGENGFLEWLITASLLGC